MSKTYERASGHFDGSEDALDCLCSGCIRETGWLYNPNIYETPSCAMRIINDAPCLVERDGVWRCDIREAEYQMVHQAELDLYKRRMAGDWS